MSFTPSVPCWQQVPWPSAARDRRTPARFVSAWGCRVSGWGYAQPVSSSFAVRGDLFTLGSRDVTETESDIVCRGNYKLQRAALLADWFPFSGGFRLTGGAVFNTDRVTLDASGASGTLNIGDRTYTTTAADGLNVQVSFRRPRPT